MHILSRKAYVVLLLGDISILYLSVWVTLGVRYLGVPPRDITVAHLASFSVLFVAWFAVYFIAGLYERYTVLFRKQLPKTIFLVQAINIAIAALFFFLIPLFQITPKTILIIYLFISTALLYFWRVYMYPHILVRREIGAVLVGTSQELSDLVEEVNSDPLYPLEFRAIIHPELIAEEDAKKTISLLIESDSVSTVVADMENRSLDTLLRFLYEVTFVEGKAVFIDVRELYQEIFERVPLSLIDDRWLLHNVSASSHVVYDVLKRAVDIFTGIVFGVLALVLLPFVALAIKLEDEGPVFISQTRIGKHAHKITLYKFRSMTFSDNGVWIADNAKNEVTKVGAFLRRTRIDELPQLWNVLRGDISLVGPRPDIEGLYDNLAQLIPFYSLRYSIQPGLTGWAQVTQQYENGNISPQSLRETRMRLQYDLYYIKERSFWLDLYIVFATAKIILFRPGS
jgi:lipopolysaccharide/colanic/teichoic acid biosynthesis glycosyltransferase